MDSGGDRTQFGNWAVAFVLSFCHHQVSVDWYFQSFSNFFFAWVALWTAVKEKRGKKPALWYYLLNKRTNARFLNKFKPPMNSKTWEIQLFHYLPKKKKTRQNEKAVCMQYCRSTFSRVTNNHFLYDDISLTSLVEYCLCCLHLLFIS